MDIFNFIKDYRYTKFTVFNRDIEPVLENITYKDLAELTSDDKLEDLLSSDFIYNSQSNIIVQL